MGEGSMRRKKKVQHKTNVVDDKKLNAVMRRMNMTQIPGIEEINIIKDDNTVIHFTKPQLKGSIRDNSYVVSGNCENKEIKDFLPGILTQLGPKSMNLLKEYVSSIKDKKKDEDDIPDLEENFEDYEKNDTEKVMEKNDTEKVMEKNDTEKVMEVD